MLVLGNLESRKEWKWEVNIPQGLSTKHCCRWCGSICSSVSLGLCHLGTRLYQDAAIERHQGKRADFLGSVELESELLCWQWIPFEEEMNPPQGLYNLATDFDLISFTSSQHVALNTVQDISPAGSPSCLYNTPLDSALVFVCPQNWPCVLLSPSLKEYVPRPPNTDSFCPLKVHPLLMPLCKWHNNPDWGWQSFSCRQTMG